MSMSNTNYIGAILMIVIIIIVGIIAQSKGLIPDFNKGGFNGDGITRIYNGTSFSQFLDSGDNDYIGRFKLITHDYLGDDTDYELENRLIGTSVGHEVTGDWYAYYYACYRFRGGGVGDTGDLHAIIKIWDARNMTQFDPTLVQYEISKVSWGELRIYIDDILYWNITQSSYPDNPDRPFRANVDGGFFGNGTVT